MPIKSGSLKSLAFEFSVNKHVSLNGHRAFDESHLLFTKFSAHSRLRRGPRNVPDIATRSYTVGSPRLNCLPANRHSKEYTWPLRESTDSGLDVTDKMIVKIYYVTAPCSTIGSSYLEQQTHSAFSRTLLSLKDARSTIAGIPSYQPVRKQATIYGCRARAENALFRALPEHAQGVSPHGQKHKSLFPCSMIRPEERNPVSVVTIKTLNSPIELHFVMRLIGNVRS